VLHDLRAPLMTARAYLDLLAAESLGPLSTDARDVAGRAAIAAARAQVLATALAGTRQTAEATPQAAVALGEVFDDVLAALDAPIRAAGAHIEVGDLPTVRGDREALYRVFANLVENAVKYRKADATAPRIVVSASRQGAHWRVAVRDWGIGIAAEERGQVFEARTRGARGIDRPGQGLGLATVRTLVREQGGEVALAPDVQDGICIEVMLPAE
jgi:signal transduction histidine kinase